MFKNKKDKIHFISTIDGLESIEECLPKPAKYFIPKWFKDIKPNNEIHTVRLCPSFPDFFSQGYIIPMWSDVNMKYIEQTGQWAWRTPAKEFSWDMHLNGQFLDHVDATFNGVKGQFVFKPDCPWKIITPPGWSVLQLPLFYHFNQEWSILPGVIDTDVHHDINQQVLYHGDGKEVSIKRGDPFVLYIPFKRSDVLKHEIRYANKKDKKIFSNRNIDRLTRFTPTGYYRDLQRKRDKGV